MRVLTETARGDKDINSRVTHFEVTFTCERSWYGILENAYAPYVVSKRAFIKQTSEGIRGGKRTLDYRLLCGTSDERATLSHVKVCVA